MTTSPTETPLPVAERRKAAPKTRSFLFINKDAESEVLSRSSGRVATSINSHVQRWQDKKGGRSKGQGKAPAVQQASIKGPAYKDCVTKFRPKAQKKVEETPSEREREREREREHERKHEREHERKHSVSSSSGAATAHSTTPEAVGTSPEGDAALELIRQGVFRVPQPREIAIYSANFSGADCIDPFKSTYAHYPGVQPIFEYYISFTRVSTFQSDAKAKSVKKEPLHFPAIRRVVQGSLTHEMHLYALLAATAARMKHVSGITFPRESSPEYLLHNAIRCIREHFAKCTGPLPADDRQLILDIFYLCVCEWYEKSYAVARTHLAFVRHFWKSLHPSESLFDKYIHDMIAYNDVFLAIETATPPLFELTWEPEELPTDQVHEVEDESNKSSVSPGQSPSSASTTSHSTLSPSTSSSYSMKPSTTSPIASGFTTITTSNSLQLPDELIGILKDLIPLIQTAHQHRQTSTPPSPTETQYASLKTQALLYKLHSLPHPATTPASSITLTLTILLSCMSTSPAWRAGKLDMPGLSHRLRSTLCPLPQQSAHYPIDISNIHCETTNLPTLSPSFAGIGDSLLLWILVSGAFAAQTHLQSEQWFLMQAVPCAKRMGLYDAGMMQTELMRYLYLDHLEDVTVKRLCTAVRPS